jgi:uncharacterized protein YlzI (FlbEa/FlbD family)
MKGFIELTTLETRGIGKKKELIGRPLTVNVEAIDDLAPDGNMTFMKINGKTVLVQQSYAQVQALIKESIEYEPSKLDLINAHLQDMRLFASDFSEELKAGRKALHKFMNGGE